MILQETGIVQTEDPVAMIQVVEAIEKDPVGDGEIVFCAEQEAVVPPFEPVQLQV